jgi:hypothetical protein
MIQAIVLELLHKPQHLPALKTPYFAEEISPFLEVFSGWYLSKKIPNHLFSGMHGCRGCVCLW